MSYNTLMVDNSGNKIVTTELQSLIDKASSENTQLIINKGIYLISPLFLRDNSEIVFEKGAVLKGTIDESYYNDIYTRVAGIELNWYPALLNVIGRKNVKISGNGMIDGSGEYWWEKYWGKDMKGGMRKKYDEQNLRFLCDYDCKRPRNILISNSNNVIIEDLTSYKSGFWNIHILYSSEIILKNVKVESYFENSPSTDGIDIDSSNNVLIKDCVINCNDDSICIKSGRDYDGLKVQKKSSNIKIEDCKLYKGFGITIGSEVSGGIEDIDISNCSFFQTDCGFRVKSGLTRKGYIKDIRINNLYMEDVVYPFNIFLNWNPNYSNCVLPNNCDIKSEALDKLMKKVDDSILNTKVTNITINNIKAILKKDKYSRAFQVEGFSDSLIENITFNNTYIEAKDLGIINYAKNIKFINSTISILDKRDSNYDEYDNR